MRSLKRTAQILAILCGVLIVLEAGAPHFTNASIPRRFRSTPWISLTVARSVGELEDILADAPSPDREVARIKAHIDMALSAAYAALFCVAGSMLGRRSRWAFPLLPLALGAAFAGIQNDLAILQVISLPLASVTPDMITRLHQAGSARWILEPLPPILAAAFAALLR